MREITEIFIHTSATPANLDVSAHDIRTWHMIPKPDGPGFRDIGYHWVIRRDGTVETGRHPSEVGAHVRGRNANSLGICLVGGVDEGGAPEFNYSKSQIESLEVLVEELLDSLRELQEEEPSIRGHNEVANKACPCFKVAEWWYG